MSGYTNAIFDEEFLKSAFNKFVEGGKDSIFDEELLKSASEFVKYGGTEEEFIKNKLRVLMRVVEDALHRRSLAMV